MRFIPIGTPITGQRHGVVFNKAAASPQNPGSVLPAMPRARSRVIPLQPTPPRQVAVQQQLAAIAAFWATLNPATQLLWAYGTGIYTSAYANFIGLNTLMVQWGLSMYDSPPAFQPVSQVEILSLWPEPDGISTTLPLISYGPNAPGIESWLRLYVSWTPVTQPTPGYSTWYLTSGTQFVGSFGPIDYSAVSLWDFTDIQNAAIGQWCLPSTLDVSTMTYCGTEFAIGFQFYVTDQFGRQDAGYQPVLSGVFPQGWALATANPGVCPIAGPPPYPWPTAAAYWL